MLIAVWPLVLAVLGLLLWVLATANPKVSEIGRLLFVCSLFWLVYSLTGHTLKL